MRGGRAVGLLPLPCSLVLWLGRALPAARQQQHPRRCLPAATAASLLQAAAASLPLPPSQPSTATLAPPLAAPSRPSAPPPAAPGTARTDRELRAGTGGAAAAGQARCGVGAGQRACRARDRWPAAPGPHGAARTVLPGRQPAPSEPPGRLTSSMPCSEAPHARRRALPCCQDNRCRAAVLPGQSPSSHLHHLGAVFHRRQSRLPTGGGGGGMRGTGYVPLSKRPAPGAAPRLVGLAARSPCCERAMMSQARCGPCRPPPTDSWCPRASWDHVRPIGSAAQAACKGRGCARPPLPAGAACCLAAFARGVPESTAAAAALTRAACRQCIRSLFAAEEGAAMELGASHDVRRRRSAPMRGPGRHDAAIALRLLLRHQLRQAQHADGLGAYKGGRHRFIRTPLELTDA